MSKLLNKPFRTITFYALFILGCSIPIYYLVVDYIWLEEIDEHNANIKERVENKFRNLSDTDLTKTLEIWNNLNSGTKIEPTKSSEIKADIIYTKAGRITDDKFRGLSSYININGKPYHLIIETNIEETIRILLAITIVTFLFFVLLVVGFIVLNKRISMKIWEPFYSTLDKIKIFDLNNSNFVEFEKSEIEEFNELTIELNKLIKKNISVFNQQKTFLENAAHELQTPLAVLKSKIDLLLQNKSLTNEQSEIINIINLSLSKVTRINKNLLLLSKIENQQFSENEPVFLTAIIDENIELLTDYIDTKEISLTKITIEQPILICNKILLEILVTNLLINAIRHNASNGKITIEIKQTSLCISNSGITALDNSSIFKRFVVSSTEKTSSGLGLAIVKEICNRYHWQIEYSFQNNLHSFLVKF